MTSDVTALLDNPVTLECEVRGVPLPAITWYKNGEAILSSRQAQYVDRGHFLKISRVQESDSGHYTCRVTSVAGTAEKAYDLDVYGELFLYFMFWTFRLTSIFSSHNLSVMTNQHFQKNAHAIYIYIYVCLKTSCFSQNNKSFYINLLHAYISQSTQ